MLSALITHFVVCRLVRKSENFILTVVRFTSHRKDCYYYWVLKRNFCVLLQARLNPKKGWISYSALEKLFISRYLRLYTYTNRERNDCKSAFNFSYDGTAIYCNKPTTLFSGFELTRWYFNEKQNLKFLVCCGTIFILIIFILE